MSDDAPQPQTNFFESTSRSFAKLTHFIDNNIRIIQYGVYCAGGVGLVLVLHSARAFTKFGHIQDIPKEFITKHVRLHGRVRWVGTNLPAENVTSLAMPSPALPLPKDGEARSQASPNLTPSEITSHQVDIEKLRENVSTAESAEGMSLSKDNRGIYEGAGELHPWENNIDPDVARIHYEEDLQPLYLQVEHTPVIPLLQRHSSKLLPLQLADVEVTREGFMVARECLLEQRIWFTLISHEPEDNILVAYVRPAKLLQRRSINEELVGKGLALTAPMDLALHGDQAYAKHYQHLLHVQDRAEKKQVGMWKIPANHTSILAKIWMKIRSLFQRKDV